jgi:hypothetical protein
VNVAAKKVPGEIFQSRVTAERKICDSSLNDHGHGGSARSLFSSEGDGEGRTTSSHCGEALIARLIALKRERVRAAESGARLARVDTQEFPWCSATAVRPKCEAFAGGMN